MTYTNPRPQHPTIQADVTGSRSFNGTVYHNTSLYPLIVTITMTSISAGANTIYVYSDASATPTLQILRLSHDATVSAAQISGAFVVLPNNYYKVTTAFGSPALNNWIEWS